jgi:general L-amino acid transport system substrate-binding protein
LLASTVALIRARSAPNCGVTLNSFALSQPDSQDEWHGIDADERRTTAAAIPPDARKVRFVPSSTQEHFALLEADEANMPAPSRRTAWHRGRPPSLDEAAGLGG